VGERDSERERGGGRERQRERERGWERETAREREGAGERDSEREAQLRESARPSTRTSLGVSEGVAPQGGARAQSQQGRCADG
jgi:hypothetical protein